jgi:hypothetical protein
MKKIFISYCHQDTEYKDKLVKQLKILDLAGLCNAWDDSRIQTAF